MGLNLSQIKDLMRAMGKNEMSRLEIEEDGFRLTLERGGNAPVSFVAPVAASPSMSGNPMQEDIDKHMLVASPTKGSSHPESGTSSSTSESDSNSSYTTSPMVGTFYSSPAPGEPQFVKAGDVVTSDTVVCIVEAMKVMNEVKAGVSGTVEELLVEDGHPVEFGTNLIKIASK